MAGRRWICHPTFDKVCVQGGCGYCNPYNHAGGFRALGSRKVTEAYITRRAGEQGLDVSTRDILDGMRRQAVNSS